MTDAALPITQSAVERFTRRYLESLGCSIETAKQRWRVMIPREVNTEIGEGELSIICSADESDVDEGEQALHLESTLFQNVLEEAANQAPIGIISISCDDVKIRLPGWVIESDFEVLDTTFVPYYDRTAVTALFQVSVETVSEYQTELLRVISFDARSKERLPGLSDEYLNLTSADHEQLREATVELPRDEIGQHLEFARQEVQESVQPEIDELHRKASHAADVELEEYRRLQQQRIDEIEEDLDSLANRIDELSQEVQETTEQADRREALQERKRLKSEQDELSEQLIEIRERREAGFPDEQREIRERHGLEVNFKPVAITMIRYEAGDLTLSLATDSIERTITIGYGSGVGVVETLVCDRCEDELTLENSIFPTIRNTICQMCGDSTSR